MMYIPVKTPEVLSWHNTIAPYHLSNKHNTVDSHNLLLYEAHSRLGIHAAPWNLRKPTMPAYLRYIR